MKYDEALSYLTTLGAFGIKPGLERIELLLKKLGNPEKKVSFIHVTGTNGKGSVTSMLTKIFQCAKVKTGNFTSPHLVKWNERVNVCGESVSDEDLAAAITRVKIAAEEVSSELEMPTQFEFITAVAFYLFAKAKLDVVVLEVGMGGLLDSTNVIVPMCSIITNVSLDHVDKLGCSVEEVAEQKAGIIKDGVPVVTAVEGSALAVVKDVAAGKNSNLYVLNEDFFVNIVKSQFHKQEFAFSYGDYKHDFALKLAGEHQVQNAALAVMTALLVSEKMSTITTDVISEGLLQAAWAGRLEKVADEPIVILDGAHNFASAKVLREAIDTYYADKRVCFVIGIMKDKDITKILDVLVKSKDVLIATKADDSERAAKPQEILSSTTSVSYLEDDVAKAVSKAKDIAGSQGLVVVAGSLYLVGQVKALQCN